MKIAIDLNDVVRDYTDNFIRQYMLNYNHEFDADELDIWTNDLESVLPFKSTNSYNHFVYEDFAYEIFGKCDTCTRNLSVELKKWLNNLDDLDVEEPIEVMFVSTREGGASLNYSYFFISKLGCNVREVYMPNESLKIWDKCDVLITANPLLLQNKPEGKITVKVEKPYNTKDISDYTFKTFSKFITDKNNINNIIENGLHSEGK